MLSYSFYLEKTFAYTMLRKVVFIEGGIFQYYASKSLHLK